MIYLASPYSHPDPKMRELRFVNACEMAGAILRSGRMVFSPIAHSHPIVTHSMVEMDGSFDAWVEWDRWFIERCDELWVLTLTGWQQSVGVQAECDIARSLGKPLRFIAEGSAVPSVGLWAE
jgi:hypothetical protein